eukprot:TRINITY_DN19629_c0_g1_i1.p1 TRINITY_DN19629_c0_g1~~TRINITY_DN19629_c0_g1_i1.p1  ORF type:complete len:517 (+),score=165.31 TRINITY_DN19629_c0_g1_i1:70-1551(+)
MAVGALKLVAGSGVCTFVLWWFMMASSPLEQNWHGCVDEAEGCKERVKNGECKSDREVMKKECKESCGFCDHFHANCVDAHEGCKGWADAGECERNPAFMVKNCQRACGTCVACLEVHAPDLYAILHIADKIVSGHPSFSNTDYSLSLVDSVWTMATRSGNAPVLKLPTHTDTPYDESIKHSWMIYKDGKWETNKFITVSEASCEKAVPLNIPESVLNSRIELKEGVHYYADYDMNNLKPAPKEYAYPAEPAFLYPEDLKDAPKIQFHIVSYQPKIYYFPRFLSDEEADNIMDEAKNRLERSGVVPIKGKNATGTDDVRTSSGCWLDNSHKSVETVRRRMLAVTGFRTDQTEKLQVLRYQLGQKYNSHLDYYQPHGARNEEEAREMWRLKWNNNWNRAATFFLYLSTTEEGGETTLPRANGGPQPASMTDCTKGIRVRPVKGAAVLFYDMMPDKTQDPYSLHGGCPVIKGEKWAAPQWLHIKVRDEGASGGFW